jgi:hypothetical protein
MAAITIWLLNFCLWVALIAGFEMRGVEGAAGYARAGAFICACGFWYSVGRFRRE